MHVLTLRTVISVPSRSVIVCELPLLEIVVGFTRVEVQSVALKPRLQAHVMGHKFCYEVLRLDKDRKGNMIKNTLASN